MYRLWVFCTLCCVIYDIRVTAKESECTFVTTSSREKDLMKKLKPLVGRRLSKTVQLSNESKEYRFDFGFCTNAVDNKDYENVGMLQTEVNDKPTHFVVGLYNSTQIKGGDDWMFLIYKNGDKYRHHCAIGNTSEHLNREAHIMISCNPNTEMSELHVLEENTDANEECYYLFQLTSKYVCTVKPKTEETLGAGSIFCIIFFTTAGVYLIIGFLYQRIVVGAKGLEQIPNFSFWKEFGKLQADGCDLLCRCGERQEMKMYRGIDDQLLNSERREEPDDRLLPM